MKWYTSTLENCNTIKESQNSFYNLPNDTGTNDYSIPEPLQGETNYCIVVSDTYYNNLSDENKARCSNTMPSNYEWVYED